MEELERQIKQIILNKYGNMKKFADEIEMSWSTLDSILKRGIMNSNISNVLKISQALGIDAESLASGNIVLLKDQGSSIDQEDSYYINDDAKDLAEFLYNNPDYKVLFDASKKVKKEDIELVKAMLDRFK